MEMVHVSRTYEWHRCRDIALHDRVRLEIRNGDTGVLPMVGKVIGITRSLPEAGPATVRLKVGVYLGTGRNDVAAVAGGDEYGSSDYVDPTYSPVSQPVYLAASAQAEDISFGVHGDIEAVLRPGPLVVPVDATRLQDPWYAVGDCFIDSQADVQMAIALGRLQSGGDPRAVVRDYPTTLQVGMRFLPMTSMIERQYECHAVLTVSPRGVNMQGGEP
ncbi:hypothetical protein MKK88_21235 [Methylobacterium sp. E-005]|uniref:hypothetical protein n=1 Tax=Methylobacterium sp. E-005 TaxID=2836549 RepID=UPI001FBAC129|nr:hypothetical protein [Methylobacterium sp. E-005]MCJ2088485.1 hypothetical protein [Methylobacterium sp. E-005]